MSSDTSEPRGAGLPEAKALGAKEKVGDPLPILWLAVIAVPIVIAIAIIVSMASQ
jgi:hypothetical protein